MDLPHCRHFTFFPGINQLSAERSRTSSTLAALFPIHFPSPVQQPGVVALVQVLSILTSSLLAQVAISTPRSPGPVLGAPGSKLDPTSSEVRGSASVRANSLSSLPKTMEKVTSCWGLPKATPAARENIACPHQLPAEDRCIPGRDLTKP